MTFTIVTTTVRMKYPERIFAQVLTTFLVTHYRRRWMLPNELSMFFFRCQLMYLEWQAFRGSSTRDGQQNFHRKIPNSPTTAMSKTHTYGAESDADAGSRTASRRQAERSKKKKNNKLRQKHTKIKRDDNRKTPNSSQKKTANHKKTEVVQCRQCGQHNGEARDATYQGPRLYFMFHNIINTLL